MIEIHHKIFVGLPDSISLVEPHNGDVELSCGNSKCTNIVKWNSFLGIKWRLFWWRLPYCSIECLKVDKTHWRSRTYISWKQKLADFLNKIHPLEVLKRW